MIVCTELHGDNPFGGYCEILKQMTNTGGNGEPYAYLINIAIISNLNHYGIPILCCVYYFFCILHIVYINIILLTNNHTYNIYYQNINQKNQSNKQSLFIPICFSPASPNINTIL